MNGMQQEYRHMESGQWAVANPLRCPCRGNGYVLSDLDTWHKCPIHQWDGMGHPEDDGDCEGEMLSECTDAEREAYHAAKDRPRISMLRRLFAAAAAAARADGFDGDFTAECSGMMHDTDWLKGYSITADAAVSPGMWVAAAEDLAEDAHADNQADGYEPEGPGITEPMECAYGPQESTGLWS